jgi:hypothetical protein
VKIKNGFMEIRQTIFTNDKNLLTICKKIIEQGKESKKHSGET